MVKRLLLQWRCARESGKSGDVEENKDDDDALSGRGRGTAMVSSQTLFRRHRNRDADEGDAPAAPAASGGGDGDAGESSSGSALVGAPPQSGRDGVGAPQSQDAGSSNSSGPFANTNGAINATSLSLAPTSELDEADEEQELIVQIPHPDRPGALPGAPTFALPAMPWEPNEESTALRREAIHREVERVQRANFIHFLILCLVPTALLFIVIAAIVSEDGDCAGLDGGAVVCEREPRSFVNAFTSRCICEAVRGVAAEEDADAGGENADGG
ncbi:hypothetical protein ACHAXT_012631 [Thalassiosira profunda]